MLPTVVQFLVVLTFFVTQINGYIENKSFTYNTFVKHIIPDKEHHKSPSIHSGLQNGFSGLAKVYKSGFDDGFSRDHHTDYYHYPKYIYKYGVKDPHSGDNKKAWETRDGDFVKGGYQLDDSDGTTRLVEYTADKYYGFKHSPNYSFKYGVTDFHSGDNKSVWETRKDDIVKGTVYGDGSGGYTFYQPDGVKRIVEYTADKYKDFNAVVQKIDHPVHQTVSNNHNDFKKDAGHSNPYQATSYAIRYY